MHPQNKRSLVKLEWTGFIVLILATVALCWYAVSLRYNLLVRQPLWLDEGAHVISSINAESVWSISESLIGHNQPALDYILRRIIWNWLLPLTVIGIRIPAFIFSLLHIVFLAIALSEYQRATGRKLLFRLDTILLMMAAIIWIGLNPVELVNSAQARHYSLVSLASTFWGVVCICRCFDSALNRFFSRFLLINCHFFSMPIVLAELLVRTLFDLKRRARPWKELGATLVAGLWTIFFNWPTFAPMLTSFSSRAVKLYTSKIYVSGAPKSTDDIQVGWLKHCWTMTLRSHESGGLVIYLLAGSLLVLILRMLQARTPLRRQVDWTILALVLAHFVEIFFILNRTSYKLGDRHLVVFWGLSTAVWICALGAINDHIRRLIGINTFAFLALLTSSLSLATRWDEFAAVQSESRKFHDTRLDEIMLYLHDQELPILYIVSPCWADASVDFYLNYLERTHLPPEYLEILFKSAIATDYCSNFDISKDAGITNRIEEFFSKRTTPIVVFNTMHRMCPRNVSRSISLGAMSVQMTWDRYSCFWIVKGARSKADVEYVQHTINFPSLKARDASSR